MKMSHKKNFSEKNFSNNSNLRNENERQIKMKLIEKIKILEEEKSLNIEQFKKFNGTPVRFGEIIQLMHFQSNKFLCFEYFNVSDYENENLR